MSDREITLYIVDIFIAIDKIKRYISRFHSAADFLHSELEWDASLRELQIIGDAVNILLKNEQIDLTDAINAAMSENSYNPRVSELLMNIQTLYKKHS